MASKKDNNEELKNLLAEVMKDDVAQGRALKLIFRDKCNLFITGKAGSGKTTFMKKIVPLLKGAMIVGPTGVTAINAGGETIHSFFGLSVDMYLPIVNKNSLLPNLKISDNVDFVETLKSVRVLIIDDVSTVRADLLDEISDVLQQVKRAKRKPFGGVRLIMLGDLSQLPPILTIGEESLYYKYYDSPYFFSSKALRLSGFSVVEFTNVYRQDDKVFVDILNNVRKGKLTNKNISFLRSRCKSVSIGLQAIQIVPYDNIAERINKEKLSKVTSESYSLDAEISGTPPNDYVCEKELILKVGCQVIFITDGSGCAVGFDEDRQYALGSRSVEYVSGSIGVVKAIFNGINTIVVKMSDEDGSLVAICPYTWENNRYYVDKGCICTESIGSITQYPVKLGYAISVHKVKGMTIERVIIDSRQEFTEGQLYMAMSRCKKLDNMYLDYVITKNHIKQDERLIDFYKKNEKLHGIFPAEVIK